MTTQALQDPQDSSLGSEGRSRLRFHVRVLVDYVTIGRAREIAKEARLLGKAASRATPLELKRLVPDGDRLSAVLAEALADRARQRAAISTIAKLGDEAFRSQRVDPRVGAVLTKARTALLEGDWGRVDSRLAQLSDLGQETDADLVGCARLILGSMSQQVARVRAALVTTLPTEEELQSARTSAVHPVQSWLEARGAPAPATDPEPPATRQPSSAVPEPIPVSKSDEAGGPAVTPREASSASESKAIQVPVDVPATPISWRAAIDLWRTWLDEQRSATSASGYDIEIELVREAMRGLDGVVAAVRPDGEAGLEALEAIESRYLELAKALTSGVEELSKRASALRSRVHEDLVTLGCVVDGQPLEAAETVVASIESLHRLRVGVDGMLSRAQVFTDGLADVTASFPEWPGWGQACEHPRALGLRRGVADLERRSLEARAALVEHRRDREEQEEIEQALRDDSTACISLVPADCPAGLRFEVGRPLPTWFPASTFYRRSFDEITKVDAGPSPYFLPLEFGSDAVPAYLTTQSEAPPVRLTVEAANLVRHWASKCASDYYPPSRLLLLVADARTICDAATASAQAEIFGRAVVGLALESCADDRTRASGRRRRNVLLTALDREASDRALLATAKRTADLPAMARACAELLHHGFGAAVVSLTQPCAEQDAVAGRALVGAIAAAVAGLARPSETSLVHSVLQLSGLQGPDIDSVEDYLEDSQKKRKGREVEVPDVSGPSIVHDLVRDMGSRFRERGLGDPQVNVSMPQNLATAHVYAPPGASSVEFPLLVSATGTSGVVGVEVVFQRPAKGASPIPKEFIAEQHVTWLSDRNLRETASVLVPCRVDVDGEHIADFQQLELSVRVNWLGARGSFTTVVQVPLTHEPPAIRFKEVLGVGGEPVNLLVGKTLEFSSESVRKCFRQLRDGLAAGRSVRAVVYGRRRRGKSSISLSLSLDPGVQLHWHVVRDQLNSTPLTSLGTALERLGLLLSNGLRAANVPVVPPSLPQEDTDRVVTAFQQWLRETFEQAREPVRVLLLLDEFQRWMSALDRRAAQALLTILREFNERAHRNVEVSLVLFGLRNLWDLTELSNDFRLAVDRYEIKPLTRSEAGAYLDEVLEPRLDGRGQRRLWRLSGGNPYVMNRLGESLQSFLRDHERTWATALDVEALVEDVDARDGRLDDFLAYMVREGEEDNAPTLRQLTVLRGVASLIHDRRDYDGDVPVEEVESWLGRHQIVWEPGLPAEQLKELAKIGILDELPSGRYGLGGEWICRQLALMKAALQPVVRREITDLILNRFHEKRRLATGGQGDVLLVENVVEGGNDVVLKIYRGGQDIRGMIEREKLLLGKIQHPGVVKCLGAQVDPNHGGVVILQRVDGESLQSLLDEHPEGARSILPGGDPVQQIDLFVQVADALAECHACNIAHKDLTPANIMVAQRLGRWAPTIIDFGTAGIEGETDGLFGRTTQIASPGFTSPEKAAGKRRSRASDVWALGMIMLYTFTGHSPVADGFAYGAVLANSGLRERLASLLERMLDPQPEARPSASEVRDQLRIVLKPTTWRELVRDAEDAAINDRWADAAELCLSGLNTAPRAEHASDEYLKLLVMTVVEVLPNVPVTQAYYRELTTHVVEVSVLGQRAVVLWRPLFAQLDDPTWMRDARDAVLRTVLEEMGRPSRNAALARGLVDLGRPERQLPDWAAAQIFDQMIEHSVAGLIEPGVVGEFCLRRAQLASAQDLSSRVQVWLRRAELFGNLPARRLEEIRAKYAEKTQPDVSDPIPCKTYVGAQVGEAEKGHLAFERIETFARQVNRRCDFVCGIRRVNRDRSQAVSRPTLQPLESARGIRRAEVGSVNVIYALLDESYTKGDGALRVQILLETDTTAAQREAAFRRLGEEEDLFDVRR